MAPPQRRKLWKSHGNYYLLTAFPAEGSIDADKLETQLTGSSSYGVRVTYEQCPSTGRFHIHAMLYTTRAKKPNPARKWLHELFNLPGHGTVSRLESLAHAQNVYHYVGKEYTQVGEMVAYGRPFPSEVTVQGTVDEDESSESVSKDWKRKVVVFYGPGSTGKSTRAHKFCVDTYGEEPYVLTKPAVNGSEWLGDYTGQRGLILDEWDPKHFSYTFMKLLCDRRPQPLHCLKGGDSRLVVAESIFICTNAIPSRITQYFSDKVWLGRLHDLFYCDVEVHDSTYEPPRWHNTPVIQHMHTYAKPQTWEDLQRDDENPTVFSFPLLSFREFRARLYTNLLM